jgi:hypothetical protein
MKNNKLDLYETTMGRKLFVIPAKEKKQWVITDKSGNVYGRGTLKEMQVLIDEQIKKGEWTTKNQR